MLSVTEARSRARDSLNSVVQAVTTDVVFRREMRYKAPEALRSVGFECSGIPTGLPVRHYEISVDLSISALFGEGVTATTDTSLPLEARLVRYGLKPAALLHACATDAARLVESCCKYVLPAILSPYEFIPVPDRSAGGYVNIAASRTPARGQPGAWCSVVVARDWLHAKLAWLSLLFNWD